MADNASSVTGPEVTSERITSKNAPERSKNLINYYSNNTLTISVPRTDIDKEILIRLSDGQGKTVLFKTAIVISQKIYLELPLLSQAPYYGVIVGSENTHKFKIIYQN